jgi:hypothetical protein
MSTGGKGRQGGVTARKGMLVCFDLKTGFIELEL